jgi:hypothetical protein
MQITRSSGLQSKLARRIHRQEEVNTRNYCAHDDVWYQKLNNLDLITLLLPVALKRHPGFGLKNKNRYPDNLIQPYSMASGPYLTTSTQVHASPRKSTQVHASPRKSTQVHASPRKSTQVHASLRKSTQVHASLRKSTQVHASHASPPKSTQVYAGS